MNKKRKGGCLITILVSLMLIFVFFIVIKWQDRLRKNRNFEYLFQE